MAACFGVSDAVTVADGTVVEVAGGGAADCVDEQPAATTAPRTASHRVLPRFRMRL
jgi:hypothetical protein